MLLLNLVPMRPLDGAQAWGLIPRLRARARASRLSGRIVVRDGPVSGEVKKDVKGLFEEIRSTKVL
jgi:hypothetical protein